VQYIHRDSIEEDIVMNPHRNAKKLKRAYYKTDPAGSTTYQAQTTFQSFDGQGWWTANVNVCGF
jgi:hypothetical protein